MTELMLQHFTPKLKLLNYLENNRPYSTGIGKETSTLLQVLNIIKVEIYSDPSPKPHMSWQLIYGFLCSLSTNDPNPLHYNIARAVLHKIDAELLKNLTAVDLLSRRFNEFCKKIKERFVFPKIFQNLFDQCKLESDAVACEQDLHEPACIEILKIPSSDAEIDNSFELNGMFLQDALFLKVLASTGIKGTSYSQELSDPCTKRLENYKIKGKTPLGFWFQLTPEADSDIFLSPCLLVLAEALWYDIVTRHVNFTTHQVPALSTSVYYQAAKLLRPKATILQNDKDIQLISDSEVLGIINIPTIPAGLFQTVARGLPKFNSAYGHKLFRFEVQEPFRMKEAGETDYRVIKLDGGKSELAERLGFKGKKAITVLGEILYTQAYLEFKYGKSSGNLIQLTKYISPATKRDEGLLITVGTMLLPYHIFEEGGLLIPLLKDPPLIGANQYQASLYSLQMDVMAEISKYSIDLFVNGAVRISNEHWNELCIKNGIPIPFGQQVLSRWLQDGNDAGKFLELVDKEHYTLGSEYTKELAFLIEQGKRRKQGSTAGLSRKNHGSRTKR